MRACWRELILSTCLEERVFSQLSSQWHWKLKESSAKIKPFQQLMPSCWLLLSHSWSQAPSPATQNLQTEKNTFTLYRPIECWLPVPHKLGRKVLYSCLAKAVLCLLSLFFHAAHLQAGCLQLLSPLHQSSRKQLPWLLIYNTYCTNSRKILLLALPHHMHLHGYSLIFAPSTLQMALSSPFWCWNPIRIKWVSS